MVKCKICRKNGLRSPNEKVVHECPKEKSTENKPESDPTSSDLQKK